MVSSPFDYLTLILVTEVRTLFGQLLQEQGVFHESLMLCTQYALQVQPSALGQPLLVGEEGVEAVVTPAPLAQLLDRELLVLGEGGPDLDEVVSVGALELKNKREKFEIDE